MANCRTDETAIRSYLIRSSGSALFTQVSVLVHEAERVQESENSLLGFIESIHEQ